jgi:tRNA pseudouridine65 synthase
VSVPPGPLTVLAEGPDWLVVDKPSGLPCHRSKMVREDDTVVARLREQLGGPIHLAHRLDRGTSGCLLVARSPEAHARLQDDLTAGHKQYVALVRGFFRWDDPVRIQSPMKDSRGRVQDADTTALVLGRSHDPRCSLMVAWPRTGRFHQVRRHLRDLDHPVIGDRKHGDNRASNVWKAMGLPRLALHCHAMQLPSLQVRAPLSGDFATVGRTLPFWDDAMAQLDAVSILSGSPPPCPDPPHRPT